MHFDELFEVAFLGTIGSFVEWDWHDVAASVEPPVLLLFGDHEAWSLQGVRIFSEILPNVGWAEVERAGHHVFNDRSEVVFPAVSTFLRGDWPEGVAVSTR